MRERGKTAARRVRSPIRVRLFLAFVSVLFGAVAAHIYVASELFARDRLAVVHELTSAAARRAASRARTAVTTLAAQARAVLSEASRSVSGGSSSLAIGSWFAAEPAILRCTIHHRRGEQWESGASFVHEDALAAYGIQPAMLGISPSSWLQSARPGDVVLRNASVADVALLGLAVAGTSGDTVASLEVAAARLLGEWDEAVPGEMILVAADGTILARAAMANAVSGHRRIEGPPVLVDTAQDGRGAIEFVEGGVAKIGARAAVGVAGLTAIAQVRRADALGGHVAPGWQMTGTGLVIVLAAFVVSSVLYRRITAPFDRLRTAAETASDGLDVRIEGYARDEVGDLVRAVERLVARLQEAQAQLVRSERVAAFGELGAGITHEVKNPITALVGFAQLAQKKMDEPERVLELLGVIEREGLRCRDILTNYLRFARGTAAPWDRVDLNQIVQDTARVLKHHLIIHNVQLEVNLGDGVPPVMASTTELQQVLVNLALNAQEIMPEGGHVRISTSKGEDGGAVLAVSDDGPGVPEALREKIFEPFFTTKPTGVGTGLGLAVSRSIVRAHGGTLSLATATGRGATFQVCLPPAPEPLTAQAHGREPSSVGPAAAGAVGPGVPRWAAGGRG